MFELHPRLAADTYALGALPLCAVRLHKDANYPWVILVPQRDDVSEIHELSIADRALLIEESSAVAAAMQRALVADKMNVAAIGNLVRQLHVHHVARYRDDASWPAPIWGERAPRAYHPLELARRTAQLTEAFALLDGFAALR